MKRIGRRQLLQGLGAGTALLSPFVRSQIARAAGDPEANLIVFYTPNGFVRDEWGANGTKTNFTMRGSTASLEPHKQDLVVFRGISNMTYPGTIRSHNCISRILTCKAGTTDNGGKTAAGKSVDHVIANHFSQSPMVLGVHPLEKTFGWWSHLSWHAAGSATRPRGDTGKLFSEIFPSAPPPTGGGGPTTAEADAQNRRTKSILDAVRGDITNLQSRLDKNGRERLEVHTGAIRALEQSMQVSGMDEMMQEVCDSSALKADANAPIDWPGGNPNTNGKSKLWAPILKTHGELQCDLAATALACGLRRVATILWQPCSYLGVNPNGDNGGTNGHHDVSHYEEKGLGSSGRQQWIDIDKFYAKEFGYLISKLKELGILDNTIVVWVSEVNQGHDQVDGAMMTAGGKALGIKTGQFLHYPYYGPGNDPRKDSRNKSLSDVWVSVHKAMGIQTETFGDPEWCNGGHKDFYPG
ncbi:MAG: DUF1552 domain-containing protein [Myxococcales bacterium]|nr:DUF1552 domain-containing protein [Myxococcales bacterium]